MAIVINAGRWDGNSSLIASYINPRYWVAILEGSLIICESSGVYGACVTSITSRGLVNGGASVSELTEVAGDYGG